MSYLIEPSHYKPLLNAAETEQGIKVIKEFFADNLSTGLRLRRVTAPLFVRRGLGLNDDLSGTERAVTFPIKDLGDARASHFGRICGGGRLRHLHRHERHSCR